MNLWLYLLLINVVTYAIYWLDKRAARRQGERVPEVVLLALGFGGGTLAAIAAQQIIRHKNRKRSFQLAFWAVTAVQIYLLISPPVMVLKLMTHLFVW